MNTLSVSAEDEAEAGRLIYLSGIGDEFAFATLATRYRALMISAALRVIHNLEDAQDATQDALLTLWQKCKEFPNTKDQARPTPQLLILEALRISATRMELSRIGVS